MKPSTAKAEIEKRSRVPVGTSELRLEAPDRPGYMRRWVSDIKNRLQRFERGGYEFVQTDAEESSGVHGQTSDSRVRQVVGRAEGGQPIYGYLMEIRRELYDEDQAKKASELEEQDADLRGGVVKQAHPNDAKADGISVQVGRGRD